MKLESRISKLEALMKPAVLDSAEPERLKAKIADDILSMQKSGFGEWDKLHGFLAKASKEDTLKMFATLQKLKMLCRRADLPKIEQIVNQWSLNLFVSMGQDYRDYLQETMDNGEMKRLFNG